jgi:hypothetical protein
MLSVTMPSVVMLSVVKLSVVMLSVTMPSVIMLCVVNLNVAAQFKQYGSRQVSSNDLAYLRLRVKLSSGQCFKKRRNLRHYQRKLDRFINEPDTL